MYWATRLVCTAPPSCEKTVASTLDANGFLDRYHVSKPSATAPAVATYPAPSLSVIPPKTASGWLPHTPCTASSPSQIMPASPTLRTLSSLLLLQLLLHTHSSAQTPHGDPRSEADQLAARAETLRTMIHDAHSQPPSLPIVQAQLELGMTLQQLNHLKPDGGRRVPEAVQAYRSALTNIPEPSLRARVQGNLAALLLEAGHAADALVEVDLAIAFKPEPGLLFNKAKTLSTMGRGREADEAYRTAAELAHGKELSSFSKATAAMEEVDEGLLRKMEAAAAGLQAVLEAREAAAAAGGKKQRKRRAQEGKDAEWLQTGTDAELSWLGFGIYKTYDRRGQHKEAWAMLEMANRHMDKTQDYSLEHEYKTYMTLVSVFNRTFQAGGGYPDATPVFVVGLPRSGSTLVEQMLASHPAAWGAGEDTALAPLTPEVNVALNTPGADVEAELYRIGKKYVDTMRERVPQQQQGDGAGAGRQQQQPKRIVDKMLRNLWLVGYIDLILPRSTIIHIMRHPLDAGLSCFAQPFGYSGMPWAWDLDNIAVQINLTFHLAEHWNRAYPGRVHTLYYEELVQYPRQVASELLALVGLPWDEQVLNFHKSERNVATASMAQVRQPLYNSSVARWQRYAPYLGRLRQALGGTVQMYEDMLAAAIQRRQAMEAVATNRREQAMRKRGTPAAAAAAAGGGASGEGAGGQTPQPDGAKAGDGAVPGPSEEGGQVKEEL